MGPQLWNDVPKSLRSLNSINIFKQSLKAYFFNMAFEGVPDPDLYFNLSYDLCKF